MQLAGCAATARQETVTAHVRRAIMLGRIRPGERLTEQALAAEAGVSRGPVRDALRQLEREGLVQLAPHRGAVVSMLGLREAYEFYIVRGHLEGLAVRLAGDRLGDADIAYLAGVVAQMAELPGAEEGLLAAADLDLAFHQRIVACSGNRALIDLYGAMDAKVYALFVTVQHHFPLRFVNLAARHQQVVEVFLAGEWWRAEAVVAEHWHETAAQFKRLIAAAADPPDGPAPDGPLPAR
jgi:DNA-binding GntR family transcriptional regulator